MSKKEELEKSLAELKQRLWDEEREKSEIHVRLKRWEKKIDFDNYSVTRKNIAKLKESIEKVEIELKKYT